MSVDADFPVTRDPHYLFNKWKEFEERVLPADADDVQRTCMRHAFFAGCVVVLSRVNGIGEDDELSVEDGVDILSDMYTETVAYEAANRGDGPLNLRRI
jgi:hypothetical protein